MEEKSRESNSFFWQHEAMELLARLEKAEAGNRKLLDLLTDLHLAVIAQAKATSLAGCGDSGRWHEFLVPEVKKVLDQLEKGRDS